MKTAETRAIVPTTHLVEALFRYLPIHLHSFAADKRRGDQIGIEAPLFFNGPCAVTPDNRIAIFGRLSRVTHWESRENQSRIVGTILDLESMVDGHYQIDDLIQEQPIEFHPRESRFSLEDMRLTPFMTPDGEPMVIGIAVLYGGLRVNQIDGSIEHDVSLGFSLATPDFQILTPVDQIHGTAGYKNGVFLGRDTNGVSYLLARSMISTTSIAIFRNDQPTLEEGWQYLADLPVVEFLPDSIRHNLVRIGPGTNPVYLPERDSYVALFHWVVHEIHPHQPDQMIEVYRGGLIEFSSLLPPQIRTVLPYALSPFGHPDQSRDSASLFVDKEVVFPVGLVRTTWQGEDVLLVSYGFNDAYQRFGALTITSLLAELEQSV